ncbi:AarF/ABC1/UbiB kinase family protein [Clostridium sp. DJ247]|uniref:ABC1 kinase family protein n=1 Tax=Clostridium sp. DJ247 TaxID=2726188 RepID=UPI001626605F|nr:AarF/ABC1/UbiB kinase family protein [Clostridium sp. DJ247]MBC2582379.1 AarF/ABC1/UbiB kinase family protein [Clostridium sp. DJ247]
MYNDSIKRFKEIIRILTFYGFGFVINSKITKDKSAPANLRKAFEELGPTFIKIGQILSTRPDMLPKEYIDELSNLQDNVTPEEYKHMDVVFFNEFHKHIDDCFVYFEKKPLASASIAQVHNAILKSGEEVIVKIQRPDISEKIKLDLSIIRKIIRLTKAKFFDTLVDPEEALNELFFSMERELDFKIEALNIKKFKQLNSDVAFCYAPYVIDEFSDSKVLTLEKIHGFKINDMTKLKEGEYDLRDLGKKLALSFFKQVFTDGFFHADPHPGNLLISEGKICFIDFGIVGSLSERLKNSLNEAIVALAFKDLDRLVSVIMSIGIKKGLISKNKLYEDIDYLLSNYLNTSLKNIQISILLQEVFNCAKDNNIQFPKDLTLLVRSLIIIEGVIAKISPDIQVLDVAIPFVKNSSKLLLFKKIDIYDVLMQLYKITRDSFMFPSKFAELITNTVSGRLKIQLYITNLEQYSRELNKIGNRLIFALIISSTIISSSLIMSFNIGPKIYDISVIGLIGFLVSLFMSFLLLISIYRNRS